jgi:diguanylate cyclase (GGDEF)-like protein
VDCWDALVSDRPYRAALPLALAMDTLRSEKGHGLDPEIVSLLERNYQDLERLVSESEGGKREDDLGTLAARLMVESKSANVSMLDPIMTARQEGQLLQSLAIDLANASRMEDVLASAHKWLSQLIRYDTLAIYLASGETIELAGAEGKSSHLFLKTSTPRSLSPSGGVLDSRTPLVNGDVKRERCYAGDSAVRKLRSSLSVHLEKAHHLEAVLALYSIERNAFTRDDLRIVQTASLHVGRALEGVLRYQNVEESAVTDHLTGVPNARSLAVHLERELARTGREETALGVLVCDLDGFKGVNDRFGHLMGNAVLQHVAKGLRETCRGSDYLARMGGDEFVVVLPALTEELGQSQIERLRRVAQDAGLAVCGEFCLSMSLGLAIYPNDGSDAQALLAAADRRMYEDKQKRKAELATSPR